LNLDIEQRWDKAAGFLDQGKKSEALFILHSLLKDGELYTYVEIANIYLDSSGGGVEQDYKKALEWFIKGAEIAEDEYAYYGIAHIYFYGLGVEVDYDLAYQYLWYLDPNTSIAESRVMLGLMYQKGLGVTKSLKRAEYYFKKSYSKGNLIGYSMLGRNYLKQKIYLKGCIIGLCATVKIFKEARRYIMLYGHAHSPLLRG
jgi:TPR repeat protein